LAARATLSAPVLAHGIIEVVATVEERLLSPVSEMYRVDKDALGPSTAAQFREYLSDIWASESPSPFPTQAIIKAVGVVKAMEVLAAEGMFLSIQRSRVVITWPVYDVVIEITISDVGNVYTNGGACAPGSPKVKISTVVDAIFGARDVALYQNMIRGLE
jgi:hypothetical protein